MNKTLLTVSQVFIAIPGVIIVLYALLVFGGFGIFLNTNTPGSYGLFASIGLILLIIGAFYIAAFIRIGQAKTNPSMKNEVIVWSIILLVTSNIIAGVCGLLGALADQPETSTTTESSLEQRLKELDNLFDNGLITLDEYQERRRRIIETL
jgi:membrane-bound ClpP family serine protease